MAALEPVDHRLVVIVLDNGIAKHPMLCALTHSLEDGWGCLEVHIGYPEGYQIVDGGHSLSWQFVPLYAMGSPALYLLIKIVLHI